MKYVQENRHIPAHSLSSSQYSSCIVFPSYRGRVQETITCSAPPVCVARLHTTTGHLKGSSPLTHVDTLTIFPHTVLSLATAIHTGGRDLTVPPLRIQLTFDKRERDWLGNQSPARFAPQIVVKASRVCFHVFFPGEVHSGRCEHLWGRGDNCGGVGSSVRGDDGEASRCEASSERFKGLRERVYI